MRLHHRGAMHWAWLADAAAEQHMFVVLEWEYVCRKIRQQYNRVAGIDVTAYWETRLSFHFVHAQALSACAPTTPPPPTTIRCKK